MSRTAPDVSVIIGAYNAMPYLTACLQSVVDQSIGLDRLEVVAVDDGSTDATSKELDRFADDYPGVVRVVHQENSGGPSGPRNVGLDLATGRYVFFLDADDRLGPEALARMVTMADEQGSDVVLGKMVGVGRGVPRTMFSRNQPRADLYTSRVWWARSAQKLFRRSHVEELGLRFPTHYRIGEDQVFTAQAYLAAQVISVVADYDCYFLTRRDDGGNITSTDTDLQSRLRFVRDICALVAERIEAGPRRDHLLRRQFGIDLESYTDKSLLKKERDEQHRLLAQAREILQAWGTVGSLGPLRALHRLRFHLIERGLFDAALEVVRFETTFARAADLVVEDGAVHARYPYFRDSKLAIPDSCYDVTPELKTVHHLDRLEVTGAVIQLMGHACVERLATTDDEVELVLRERDAGVEHRLPTSAVPVPGLDEGRMGFSAEVDLATAAGGGPLPLGLWDVHLILHTRGLRRELRLGNRRSDGVDATVRTYLAALGGNEPGVFTTYFTRPHSNLTIEVGEVKHRLDDCLGTPRAEWSEDGDALVVSGRLQVAEAADGAVSIRLQDSSGAAHEFAAVVADGEYCGVVATAALPMGRWSVGVALNLAPVPRELAVPQPDGLAVQRWRRRLRSFYAKPVGSKERLELRIAPVDVVVGIQRRLGKVVGPRPGAA
jgi:glycosyltransferase involved in cell wall biosynthesis